MLTATIAFAYVRGFKPQATEIHINLEYTEVFYITQSAADGTWSPSPLHLPVIVSFTTVTTG